MVQHLVSQLIDHNHAMQWLQGDKRAQVIDSIQQCSDYGLISVGFLHALHKDPKSKQQNAEIILNFCNVIAEQAPMTVTADKIVFFSGTSQSRAENFVVENKDYDVIHTTLPGALLELYGLFDEQLPFTREQRYQPWNTLSRRLAAEVKGNATAILDFPKPNSTFLNQEMPVFLSNKNILTVNNTDKETFWHNLEILDLQGQETIQLKEQILLAAKM